MTNHIHLIVSAKPNFNLSNILRDFKKLTSKSIIESIQFENESRRDWMLNHFEYAAKPAGSDLQSESFTTRICNPNLTEQIHSLMIGDASLNTKHRQIMLLVGRHNNRQNRYYLVIDKSTQLAL
jgi:REP element-mobilizing transposase RayT